MYQKLFHFPNITHFLHIFSWWSHALAAQFSKTALHKIIIKETQRRQHEGHNTPLGFYTDQGP